MPIPSIIAWQRKTLRSGATHRFNNRDPELGVIDDSVRAYGEAQDQAAKNRAAYAVRKACRHWQDKHTGAGKLGRYVNWLEQQAENELNQRVPGFQAFGAKKARGKAANRRRLQGGYHHERRMYKASKEAGQPANPISASQMRDALRDPGQTADQVIANMGADMWDGHVDMMARGGEDNRVRFYNKLERMEHMIVNLGGLLIWVRNNQVVTTATPFMYAMDAYGNLFACSDAIGRIQFNHSSFNAGRKVVCAGMINVQAGQLHYISNESGHYRPTRADLFSAVERLRQDGVRMAFGAGAYTRVSALGVGDWPAVTTAAGVAGFDQVAAALGGAAPAAIPNPQNFGTWP